MTCTDREVERVIRKLSSIVVRLYRYGVDTVELEFRDSHILVNGKYVVKCREECTSIIRNYLHIHGITTNL